jgi:hypothetical protein
LYGACCSEVPKSLPTPDIPFVSFSCEFPLTDSCPAALLFLSSYSPRGKKDKQKEKKKEKTRRETEKAD